MSIGTRPFVWVTTADSTRYEPTGGEGRVSFDGRIRATSDSCDVCSDFS
jgi:hypothetical protein